MNAKENPFLAVPFGCGLPRICPVCRSPAEKVVKIEAWEGIPFALTFSITVGVPYCRNHYKQLLSLRMRQRLAIAGTVILPFLAMLPALVDWSFSWVFYIGCLGSIVLLVITVGCTRQLKVLQGVRIRTMGNGPYFAVAGSEPDWQQKLAELIEQYKRTHELRNPPIRLGI